MLEICVRTCSITDMTTTNTDCLHTLNVKCPNCEKAMRLIAYNSVKFEKYDRKCRGCKTQWEITRTGVTLAGGIGFVDTTEWQEI